MSARAGAQTQATPTVAPCLWGWGEGPREGGILESWAGIPKCVSLSCIISAL